LGAIFTGSCHSDGSAHASEELVRDGCNTGYARNRCLHAAALDVDAVRFRIQSHAKGVIQIAWSSERDHHPVAVGTLQLRQDVVDGSPLDQQGRACAAVYLQRTGAAW